MELPDEGGNIAWEAELQGLG
ncbi:hypothetical protein [Variovorax boronicumulans]